MKSWKIVAIAMLAMAPAAFGAVKLSLVNPATGLNEIQMGADGKVTIALMLDPGTDAVTGVSLGLGADQPGLLRLTGRTAPNPMLSALNTDDSQLLSSANGLLNPKNLKDAGVGAPDGMTPTAPGLQLVETFTLTLEAGKPVAYPLHVAIVGGGTAAAAVWADPDFSTYPLTGDAAMGITITPEPASMLLLAAGAAFFARRRRA